MGTWGPGVFDNDSAWDWVNDFLDDPGLRAAESAIRTVAEWEDDEYLEVDESGAALAAAEVIAALKGHPNAQLPDEIKAWVETNSTAVDGRFTAIALKAIARIKSDSEMQE